ncbi:hypothetical protein BFW89_17735 [Pseudomonas synxantha]|nr:hypothetical protein BFW89_17735 [Pseudomonas synxantha]
MFRLSVQPIGKLPTITLGVDLFQRAAEGIKYPACGVTLAVQLRVLIGLSKRPVNIARRLAKSPRLPKHLPAHPIRFEHLGASRVGMAHQTTTAVKRAVLRRWSGIYQAFDTPGSLFVGSLFEHRHRTLQVIVVVALIGPPTIPDLQQLPGWRCQHQPHAGVHIVVADQRPGQAVHRHLIRLDQWFT